MKRRLLAYLICLMAFSIFQTRAIDLGQFGVHGEGGSKNGQIFSIGEGGNVYELNAFLSITNLDLNGNQLGLSGDLSLDSLPEGLTFNFSSQLSTNKSNLLLSYAFTNASAVTFPKVDLFILLDAEIDEAKNTFFNEYGTTIGRLGLGASDPDPDQWQIDEPGFQSGTLIRNLYEGALNNSNSIPRTALNDVAMSLGFSLGEIKPGGTNIVQILVSDYTNYLGSFALKQLDIASFQTAITFSGAVNQNINVDSLPGHLPDDPGLTNDPINITAELQLGIDWTLNRPAGSLLGTLTITNPVENGRAYLPAYRFGLTSVLARYVRPSGILNDGTPYVDLTAAVTSANGAASMEPGQRIILTNAIEVFATARVAPPINNFSFFARRR